MLYQIDQNHCTVDQLKRKLDSTQAERIFFRVFFEAMSSMTVERTKLLCAALTGALNPDMETELKSRVVRAIMILEPSDIVLLRKTPSTEPTEIFMEVIRDSLVRAGCLDFVRGRYDGGNHVQRTELDHLVAWNSEGGAVKE